MKKLAVGFAVVIASACGGGNSPTSPSQTAPPPVPAGHVIATSTGTLRGCLWDTCDDITFRVTNEGPGCVRTTDLAGRLTIQEADGRAVDFAVWELTLGSKTHNNGVMRPGDTLDAVSTSSVRRISPAETRLNFLVTRQTNVPCS